MIGVGDIDDGKLFQVIFPHSGLDSVLKEVIVCDDVSDIFQTVEISVLAIQIQVLRDTI